jgi:hypothetical protein
MKSPITLCIWQAFAQALPVPVGAFAMLGKSNHCFHADHWLIASGLHSTSCLPSPFLRSGRSLAGPTLSGGRAVANFADHFNIHFEIPVIAVEFGARTTNQRGSSKCRNPLSSLPSFRPRWPVACRTLHRAAWPVRLPVQPSPTRWMKTSLPVQHLADLPGQPLAASRLACRPATRVTEALTERAACGRSQTSSRTIRADRPGGPLSFAKGKADV